MPNREIEQIAHLMRRAGFGATREQLDAYAAQGYETPSSSSSTRPTSAGWAMTSFAASIRNCPA